MKTAMTGLLMAATMLASVPAVAQDGGPDAPPINDRSKYLPASVPTSDDVLRIPVPADYNAPKGAFVRRHRRCGTARDDRRAGQDDHRGAEAR
jgi:hypothetical protein